VIPARYVFSVLGSIAMAIIYGLKVNLSVAMVAMVNHTALHALSEAHGSSAALDLTSPVREECQADVKNTTGAVNQVIRIEFLMKRVTERWSANFKNQLLIMQIGDSANFMATTTK